MRWQSAATRPRGPRYIVVHAAFMIVHGAYTIVHAVFIAVHLRNTIAQRPG
jgi:hypothetical protein